jgi:hypothetical protein
MTALNGSAVNLSLYIGPAVPIPAPRWAIEALRSVTVNATAVPGADSGFELVFEMDKNSLLPTLFLLVGGSPPPILRVVIAVTMGGMPEVLIDGVVTHTSVNPGADGTNPTFTVRGTDLTAVMGWIDFTGLPYPALPVEARVLIVLAKYAFLGVVPVIIPAIVPDIPNPLDKIPVHQGNDLAYVRRLADRTGYIFTVIPGVAPGQSFAYWGPEAKIGVPQPALNVDMDALTNVKSLNIEFNDEHKTLPIVFIQNQQTKAIIPIPIPDVSPLDPPLGLIPPLPKQVSYIRETAKLSIPAAILLGMAKASRTSDVVKATGSLEVLRYGRVLKPRTLVGLRGVGTAFDGLYFVQQITSSIKPGEFEQRFTLVRNGLVSTLPRIPV